MAAKEEPVSFITSYILHILSATQMDSGSGGGRPHTSVKTRRWGSSAAITKLGEYCPCSTYFTSLPCRLTHLHSIDSAKPFSPAYYHHPYTIPSIPMDSITTWYWWLPPQPRHFSPILDLHLHFLCMPSTKCHSPNRSFSSLGGGTTITPIIHTRDQGPHWTSPSLTPCMPLGCPLLWPCPLLPLCW